MKFIVDIKQVILYMINKRSNINRVILQKLFLKSYLIKVIS
jgi:hypothetical protein